MQPAVGSLHRQEQQQQQSTTGASEQGSRHPHGPTAEEWDSVKDVIRQLYVRDQRSLREVKQELETKYNFRATERMFKARLGPWGLNKNSKNNDWGAMAKLHKIRRESGKSATEFLIHGRRRTLAQLRKHIRSKSMTDQQFLAAALNIEIPSYIRCYTPEQEDVTDEASSASQLGDGRSVPQPLPSGELLSSPTKLGKPRLSVTSLLNKPNNDALPLIGQISLSEAVLQTACRPESQMVNQQQLSRSTNGIMVTSPSQSSLNLSSPLATPCQHIQSQLNRMAQRALVPSAAPQCNFEDLDSWVFLTNLLNDADHSPILNCSQCNQSLFSHLNTLDDYVHVDSFSNATTPASSQLIPVFTGEHQAAALKWVVRCFSACIYMTQGTSNFAQQSLFDAESEVKNMLETDNPLTLTSLNLILSILHVHDQGSIVESIVGSALKVASNMLGCRNPITITIAWMTAAAGKKLPQPGLDASALRRVCQDFTEQLGGSHPHSITALYNLSWNLIIDGAWDEAESNLRRLYQTSCQILGLSHMQTITALTSLSRVLSNQNKNGAAIETMQEAIERSKNTIGPSHPYRLESKRRLALLYEKVNDKPQMESLYWDVLRGRVKMLGRKHPYTAGAKVDLIKLLHELGKGDDHGQARRAIEALFEQQDDCKAWHEAF
ncbi:hypothetical protein GJ744_008258 [Endocarpon pusillum]|uniref:Clr5 domain-containing protein n=1 Tax=Endocarpon pusillum TaxID=364733 RepID=A0A8H7AHL3_9EURO|nr:hypothetical protein GJ744_008258 [Endocarpon pusillum]